MNGTTSNKEKELIKKLQRGIDLMNNQKFHEAIEYYNTVIFSGNLSSSAIMKVRSLKARCFFQINNISEAYSEITSALNFNDFDISVEDLILKLLCELRLGKKDKAEFTLTNAIQTFPDSETLKQVVNSLTKK